MASDSVLLLQLTAYSELHMHRGGKTHTQKHWPLWHLPSKPVTRRISATYTAMTFRPLAAPSARNRITVSKNCGWEGGDILHICYLSSNNEEGLHSNWDNHADTYPVTKTHPAKFVTAHTQSLKSHLLFQTRLGYFTDCICSFRKLGSASLWTWTDSCAAKRQLDRDPLYSCSPPTQHMNCAALSAKDKHAPESQTSVLSAPVAFTRPHSVSEQVRHLSVRASGAKFKTLFRDGDGVIHSIKRRLSLGSQTSAQQL